MTMMPPFPPPGMPPGMAPGGIMPPSFPPMSPDQGTLPPIPVFQPPTSPGMTVIPLVKTELDRWAEKNFGVMADELPPEAAQDLTNYVLGVAERDREYWQGRNERILRHHDRYNLVPPEQSAEDAAKNIEVVTSPLPRLLVDRATSAQAGADWKIEITPRTADTTAAAQRAENLLRWWIVQAGDSHSSGRGSTLIWDVAFSGVLDGWQCALLLPSPDNPAFPWHFELEDSTVVFPTFGLNGLIRVTRQLSLSVLEARDQYPELDLFLQDYDDDDTVAIVGYYDKKYHLVIVEGLPVGPNSSAAHYGEVLKPPVPHFFRDMDGNPQVPWIINLPKGAGTRRQPFNSNAGKSTQDTQYVGAGFLQAIESADQQYNRHLSMRQTNVWKAMNPPVVVFLRANEEPKAIDFSAAATNFLAYQQNAIQVLSTTPNPSDAAELSSAYQDWLSKAGLPSVLWGDAGSVTSGFGVNLLGRSAEDNIRPFVTGTQFFLRMLFRRVLECAMVAFHDFQVPGIMVVPPNPSSRIAQPQMVTVQDIILAGTDVQVRFENLTPQDLGAKIQAEGLAVQARLHSRETAMRNVGVDDVELEKARIDLDSLLADPAIASHMGVITLDNPNMSVYERLVHAQQLKLQQMQMQLAQQQMGQGGEGGSAPPPGGGLPSQTVPPPMQPGGAAQGMPPEQNPMNTGANGTADMGAALMAMMGGSPPRGG